MEADSEESRSHRPVLLHEILDFSGSLKGKARPVIVDGTFGEGGHALALYRLHAGAIYLGFDRDPVMSNRAESILKQDGIILKRIKNPEEVDGPGMYLINRPFSDAAAFLSEAELTADFILLDLGVSIFHFSGAGRGFSYQDETLDMRLSPDLPDTASDVLEKFTEQELKDLFSRYGEERYSGRIARAVKENLPFHSARELADLIRKTVPPSRQKIHPATRVFQALRIQVNRELEEAEKAVSELPLHLSPGGRMAVISFHSLEDRIAKNAFKDMGEKLRVNRRKKDYAEKKNSRKFIILTPVPVLPGDEETEENPPSRSAKLRVLEKKAENIP